MGGETKGVKRESVVTPGLGGHCSRHDHASRLAVLSLALRCLPLTAAALSVAIPVAWWRDHYKIVNDTQNSRH